LGTCRELTALLQLHSHSNDIYGSPLTIGGPIEGIEKIKNIRYKIV